MRKVEKLNLGYNNLNKIHYMGLETDENYEPSSIVGCLDLVLVKESRLENGETNRENRYLGIGFTGGDWEAIFFDTLHCPEYEPYNFDEDIDAHTERQRQLFKQSIPEYPMLGRIWDMFEDVSYNSEESKQLREECLKLKSLTTNLRAIRGLEKLIAASDEAIIADTALWLASD
jgi:hypothetical protein